MFNYIFFPTQLEQTRGAGDGKRSRSIAAFVVFSADGPEDKKIVLSKSDSILYFLGLYAL